MFSAHRLIMQWFFAPRAQTLHEAMRQHWLLPDKLQFLYIGKEWLLSLLDKCTKEQRDHILFLVCGGPGTYIIILLMMQEPSPSQTPWVFF